MGLRFFVLAIFSAMEPDGVERRRQPLAVTQPAVDLEAFLPKTTRRLEVPLQPGQPRGIPQALGPNRGGCLG